MPKTPTKPKSLAARLWVYQRERSPILAMVAMALLSVGALERFAAMSVGRYAGGVLIVVLYLIQIRVSDEPKDFEHDNKFYPNRPVQRGLVTLGELNRIKVIVIAVQLVIYASFASLPIIAAGLLSQAYAYLTRKEFLISHWLREHFFWYLLLHYVQLVILFFAVATIIRPHDLGLLLLIIVVNIAVVELGRKNLPRGKDLAGDTYSYHLGAVWVGVLFAAVSVADLVLIGSLLQAQSRIIWLVLPTLGLCACLISADHFAQTQNETWRKSMENSAILMFLLSMMSVVIGG